MSNRLAVPPPMPRPQATPNKGQIVIAGTTPMHWDGSAWVEAFAWEDFPCSLLADGTTPSLGSDGLLVARRRLIGSTMSVFLSAAFGTTGGLTGGSGPLKFQIGNIGGLPAYPHATLSARVITSDGANYAGIAKFSDIYVYPWASTSSTAPALAQVQNQTAPSGGVGTGRPTVTGALSIGANSRLVAWGSYEVAPAA